MRYAKRNDPARKPDRSDALDTDVAQATSFVVTFSAVCEASAG